MKSIRTWVLIGNARAAHVVENCGPGRGFQPVRGASWTADDAIEFSDAPTMTHSRVGHGQRRIEQASPQTKADADFAAHLCDHLVAHHQKSEFDRLILVLAPHMLGLLRQSLPEGLGKLVMAEVPKDLSGADLARLPELLKDHIAA